jgi:hypothetical protein
VDELYRSTYCLRGKKSPVEIREVEITYFSSLPYLEISYHI